MILTEPIPFKDAIDKFEAKGTLPTELKSREMQVHTSADVRDLAFFSSRVTDARLLQDFKNSSTSILKGESNTATQRLKLKQLLASMSYRPEPGKEGTLEDLSSNARLNLILDHNVAMARGFGQWQQGNREGALEAFPAQELIRVADRAVPREWFDIWDEAADELGDATTATSAAETGRMVAMKNDPIWTAISDFGLPYPPFKFNSGMGVEDVSYEEAVDLGVMDASDDPIQPQARRLTDGLESGVEGLDADLAQALVEGFSSAVHIIDGVLRFKNDARTCAGQLSLRDRGQTVLRFLNEAREGAWN